MNDATALPAIRSLDPMDPAYLAATSFLAQYPNLGTRTGYTRILRDFFDWCAEHGLHPLTGVRRMHLAGYRGHLENDRGLSAATVYQAMNTLKVFYLSCMIDDFLIASPAVGIKLPTVWPDDSRKVWLDRFQVGSLIRAARAASAKDWATIALMASMGMRVTAVCNVRIEDYSQTRQGYRTLTTIGKGNRPSLKPVPPPVLEALDAAAAGRTDGWLLLRRNGTQMTRRSADRILKRLAAQLDYPDYLSPHDLRRSFIANGLEAGIPLRDMQLAVDHSDPKTTTSYDRRERSPHGHPAMTLAGLYAAAA